MSDGVELPRERSTERRAGLEPIAATIAATIGSWIQAEQDRPAIQLRRLEALERELYALLAESSPIEWQRIRAPLRQLLKRARRELRDRRAARTDPPPPGGMHSV